MNMEICHIITFSNMFIMSGLDLSFGLFLWRKMLNSKRCRCAFSKSYTTYCEVDQLNWNNLKFTLMMVGRANDRLSFKKLVSLVNQLLVCEWRQMCLYAITQKKIVKAWSCHRQSFVDYLQCRPNWAMLTKMMETNPGTPTGQRLLLGSLQTLRGK